jgi:RNA polymerase sigma factor (TIGR02999 family)
MEKAPVTELLAAHRAGDEQALNKAFSFVYDDLRRAARAQLRRGSSPTLNTTSLVNEAYLRLVDSPSAAPSDRTHFLALAARAMRYIIIDYARQRGAAKRGGGVRHVEFDDTDIAIDDQVQHLLSLDDAMQALGKIDERLVRVVECRFFTGMTEEETAEALQVSLTTVQRDWLRAKAWLREDMRNSMK